jgi:hypothetical protein
VGKAKRAHHLAARSVMDGGHVASLLCPPYAPHLVVMPWACPGHPSVGHARKRVVDGQDKPGHDGEMNNQLSFGRAANALSTTSPIGCQELPSNCTSRICSIGWKSAGPVLIAMPGSANPLW